MDTEDWTLQRVSSRPPHAQLTHHPPDRLFLCQCHPADTTMYASTAIRFVDGLPSCSRCHGK